MHGAAPAATAGPPRRASGSSAGQLSSEDSYEAAPPRRRVQLINAELVKLVASVAPLELAQLKAMEQKARIRKARPPAVEAVEPEGVADLGLVASGVETLHDREHAGISAAPMHSVEQQSEPARWQVRPSTADAARGPGPAMAAAGGRMRSQSATRPSYLPAAPAKGTVVKRDLNVSV